MSCPNPNNPPPTATGPSFVSRGGLKLDHALARLGISVQGQLCADLGCSTGGFTDCLLQRGAARVFSVDTGYGVLAYALRINPKVTVMERANALHATPPFRVGLVAMDLSWTPMRHAMPAAINWLEPGGVVVALIKPHYERSSIDKTARGVLDDQQAEQIASDVIARTSTDHPRLAFLGSTPSPIRGGGGKHKQGNPEWLAAWRLG